ncbi:hypothetical protein C8J57DRAFT_1287569 [Mycena rebaudengoi]|nr:hypothetical protein C8J57DRAFT_1287569 [Mycena rebaudengoi]
MSRIFAVALVALNLRHVVAQTSLVIPFLDFQPISADLLGIDASKTRTTWALRQGEYTGIFTDPQGSFPGTATLVEGADYASYTYAVTIDGQAITLGGECSLVSGSAICVMGADGTTVTDTQKASAILIEAGTTAAAAAAQITGSDSGSAPPAQSSPPSSSVRTSVSAFSASAALILACLLA